MVVSGGELLHTVSNAHKDMIPNFAVGVGWTGRCSPWPFCCDSNVSVGLPK